MTTDEQIEEIVRIIKSTDRETQIKILRAIMRYENVKGLSLEGALERELGLQDK